MKEILIAIIIMSGLAVDLLAQPPAHNNQAPPPSGAHLLKEMDSNKDGKLSKREVTGPLAQDFAKLDGNRDGFLSLVELEKAPAPPPKSKRQGPPNIERLLQMDTNKDGMLSKGEVRGPLAQDFAKLDRNRDGKLSRQELEQAPPPPPRRGQEGRMRAE